MIKGTPRFDGLALGEGSFNFLAPNVELVTKAAFVNNATGQTHGWTTQKSGWSKETMEALGQLRASIEKDLAAVHLSGLDEGQGVSLSSASEGAPPPGIGEHLGGEAPQV